jgi:Cysteine-rich secretory protein family
MSGPTVGVRRIRILCLATALVFAIGMLHSPTARGEDGDRMKLLRLLNESRDRHDLRTLRPDRSLNRDAMRHTRRMLRRNQLFDPHDLANMLADEPWDDIGASVVGCASTLKGLHRALLRHGPHRRILLHPKLRRVGIGVVRTRARNACRRGWLWATELFYG